MTLAKEARTKALELATAGDWPALAAYIDSVWVQTENEVGAWSDDIDLRVLAQMRFRAEEWLRVERAEP